MVSMRVPQATILNICIVGQALQMQLGLGKWQEILRTTKSQEVVRSHDHPYRM